MNGFGMDHASKKTSSPLLLYQKQMAARQDLQFAAGLSSCIRQPPPYPGCRHSLTDSEASIDVSQSSSENLSPSAQRQSPQGEETSCSQQYVTDGHQQLQVRQPTVHLNASTTTTTGGYHNKSGLTMSNLRSAIDLAQSAITQSTSNHYSPLDTIKKLCGHGRVDSNDSNRSGNGTSNSAKSTGYPVVNATSSGYENAAQPDGGPLPPLPNTTALKSLQMRAGSQIQSDDCGRNSGSPHAGGMSPTFSYPPNSLIGQLLQNTTEYPHLRSMLQSGLVSRSSNMINSESTSSSMSQRSCDSPSAFNSGGFAEQQHIHATEPKKSPTIKTQQPLSHQQQAQIQQRQQQQQQQQQHQQQQLQQQLQKKQQQQLMTESRGACSGAIGAESASKKGSDSQGRTTLSKDVLTNNARRSTGKFTLVNGYVNVTNSNNSSYSNFSKSTASQINLAGGSGGAAGSKIPVRDRQRPSTAPSEHRPTSAAAPSGHHQSQHHVPSPLTSNDNTSVQCLEKVGSGSPPLSQSEHGTPPRKDLSAVRSQPAGVTSGRPRDEAKILGAYPTRLQPPQIVNVSRHQPSTTSVTSSSSCNSPILVATAAVAAFPASSACDKQHQATSPPAAAAASHQTSSKKRNVQTPELDHAAIATRATQLVERLSEENRSLRAELKSYYKKVSTLEKVERDIQKVSDAYDTLVQHSQKQETLNKSMRSKLETEVKKLTDTNRDLKDQLVRSLYQLQKKQSYNVPETELKKEVLRKDSVVAKLITQNRELSLAKERLGEECSVQSLTTKSQQARIELLESALAEAQACALGYQDECDADDGVWSDSGCPSNIQNLIRQMQEKEHRIQQLEAQVVKLEQKRFEECVFREIAIEAAGLPKTKCVQADLAERDAILRLLQQHVSLSRSSSISSLLSVNSSIHSPLQRSPNNSTTFATEPSAPTTIGELLDSRTASYLGSINGDSRAGSYTGSVTGSRTGSYAGSAVGSGTSSRQGSQLDGGVCPPYWAELINLKMKHLKSGSETGSVRSGSDTAGCDRAMREMSQGYIAQHQPSTTQTSTFDDNSGLDSDQMKQYFWQV